MKITKHVDEAIKEYLELREQYEKLWDETFDLCQIHKTTRKTASNFSEWFDEERRLYDIEDYYDMIIAEIDTALKALENLKTTKNHIEIYQKRVDKLNEV